MKRSIIQPVTINGRTYLPGEEDELEEVLSPDMLCDLLIEEMIDGDWESKVPDEE